MLLAAKEGAGDKSIPDVEVVVRPALGATASDVLVADAYLLGTPVNLGYISGALKHFFDTIYYPCIEDTGGRPFGAFLHSNHDASGAIRALETITRGLGWKQAQPWQVVAGEPSKQELEATKELAASLAASLIL